MNFYAFHIGDYASATQHLTDLEDLAYRRMIDIYYVSERPLPLDRRHLYRLLRANSQDMRDAVDVVIDEFFTETEVGWRHGRCDAEIAKATEKSDKAKANGKLGGVAKAKRTLAAEVADAKREHSKGLAPNPNPNPNPNNNIYDVKRARELETRLREAAGWQNEPAPMLAVTGPIEALIAAGADLETDVLPVLSALGPRCKSRVSWNYFIGAIAAARDRRIEAATIVSPPTQPGQWKNHEQNQRKPSRDDAFSAIDRRIDEICEAERREAEGSPPGAGDPAERPARN